MGPTKEGAVNFEQLLTKLNLVLFRVSIISLRVSTRDYLLLKKRLCQS